MKPPRTFEGRVIEWHPYWPSFRVEGARQWIKMPMPHEDKRPPVGAWVRVTIMPDGGVITLSRPVKAGSIRERLKRNA